MLKTLVHKITGDPNDKTLQRIQPLVDKVNVLEPQFTALSDEALRETTAALKERYSDGATLEDLLPEAFAAVREAARRTLGMRPYDVQLVGGVVLHNGSVAEMKTGEGKTLVATLPLYLNALTGRGVHLVTPNDYLSKVGVQWMGPVYHLLGLRAAVIQNMGANPAMSSFLFDPEFQASDDRYQHLLPVPRSEAYKADVMYATNNELGFDYLRDNMVWETAHRVQRELYYAIVDEVDNILIDEARTPLIISGPAEEATDHYGQFATMVRRLRPEEDYAVEEKSRAVSPTDAGIEKIEAMLGIDNMYSPESYHLTPYFENALKAQVVFHRDKQYIVQDGEVIIVDEFTGRLMHGRRFSEGLHQAIEAKEGVRVQRESMTLATITFQNYFRMYEKLAGMTGTAMTEAEELHKIYELDVVAIPTHRDVVRDDRADYVYKTTEAKWSAVVDQIAERHKAGQPVLVGTVAIETSEMLADRLRRRGVPHEVLNAKNHEREAEIIAQAGRLAAVTIATNMAGRGVDILLGGNAEGSARGVLRKRGSDLTELSNVEWEDAVVMLRSGGDPTEKHSGDWAKVLRDSWREAASEKAQVIENGGLYVLGTERHEARRIDNQLRGRAGRQGDPGESRFYVSLEDDLMRRFGGDRVKSLMDTLGVEDDQEIESNLVSRQIAAAQVKVEGYNFDLRKHLLEYDEVINEQRKVIYDQRSQILGQERRRSLVLDMARQQVGGVVDSFTVGEPEDWEVEGLAVSFRAIVPTQETLDAEDWRNWDPEELADHLGDLADAHYEAKVERLGDELMSQIERHVILRAIDTWWVRHLTALDELRQGIGLRAFGQQDPLVTFKREAFGMFSGLKDNIAAEIVRGVFHAEPAQAAQSETQLLEKATVSRGRMIDQARSATQAAPEPVRAEGGPGRNDPCWCGSGKKYKHCHMRTGPAQPATVGRSRR